jgi:hypothetical protein
MRFVTRTPLVLLLAAVALLAAAPLAGAQSDDQDEPDHIVVVTGRAEVREGETVDNVFIADGPVVVDGTVRDALVALHGDVLVRGTVRDDVFAVDGRVVVADGGRIEGDVVSRHRPVVEEGGRVDGSWERWNPGAWRGAASLVGWLAVWLAFTISTLVLGLVLGLLAPRAAAAVDEASHDTGPVILWGLVLLIGLPIVAVIAMVTLVGFPLGFGLLLALGLIYGIGYTAGAWILGRRVARRASPILAFLSGWAILRAIALIPFLGGLVGLAAVVVGLGAIVVAGRRARRGAVVSDEPEHRPPVAPAAPAAPPPDAPVGR